MSETIDIDGAKVDELVQKAVGDFGAVLVSALVVVGDRLGLFRAMADGQPVTSHELAARTSTNERNVREFYEESLALGRAAGDAWGCAFALTGLAGCGLWRMSKRAASPYSVASATGL